MAMSGVFTKSNFVNEISLAKQFLTISIKRYAFYCSLWDIPLSERRLMTTSRRIQDRSKKKRVHDLEIVTENWKITSKILFVMEVLKGEPEQVMRVGAMERCRKQINLRKPHRISDFLRKSPQLFELYKDPRGTTWCGLTNEAEDLLDEEAQILEANGDKLAECVTRFLMMSLDKRIAIDKIAHFRRDFGLPHDFRTNWAHKYPELFRVVNSNENDGVEYLQLVSWNPAWAVTELEKKVNGLEFDQFSTPGVLSLPFLLKFPPRYERISTYRQQIERFQNLPYLSPYADARGLQAGSREFDKRAIAMIHELLSFTIEKRLVTDHLTHFRRELVMPQKLMRILLKHVGIFYVSERGKRLSVFLTEAYDGPELIDKCPLVLWKEKVQSLTGYKKRKQWTTTEAFNEFSDVEGESYLWEGGDKNNEIAFDEETLVNLNGDEVSFPDDSDMELEEVYKAYKDY